MEFCETRGFDFTNLNSIIHKYRKWIDVKAVFK